ncbi:MAG TPA: hypothetical protein DCG57_06520 [Candidatus Riflebacteria bacterium]|nr:hypothetical protein [Candidatus Riflebacteria bacterium]
MSTPSDGELPKQLRDHPNDAEPSKLWSGVDSDSYKLVVTSDLTLRFPLKNSSRLLAEADEKIA